jgi:hypothetical protein
MDVIIQLYAPAALPSGKELLVPLDRRMGGPTPELVSTLWRREKALAPTETRTPAVLLIACRYTD